MTSTEFVANKDLVSGWKSELEHNELLKIVIGVLEEESPLHEDADTVTETNALVGYGYEKGYAFCLRKLKDLTRGHTPIKSLRPTYGVPLDA